MINYKLKAKTKEERSPPNQKKAQKLGPKGGWVTPQSRSGECGEKTKRLERNNEKPPKRSKEEKIEERLKRPAYPRLWQETKHKSLGRSPVKAREKRLYLPQSGLEGHQNLVLRTKKRSEKTFPRQVSFFMFKANGRPPSRVSAMAGRQTDSSQTGFTLNGRCTSTSNVTGGSNPAPYTQYKRT